jgi:hypothetical protein
MALSEDRMTISILVYKGYFLQTEVEPLTGGVELSSTSVTIELSSDIPD